MKLLQSKVTDLEQSLQTQWTGNIHTAWEDAKRDLQKVEQWENERLCNQAHLYWMKDGYRNSKFYHVAIKDRRRQQLIQFTLPSNEVTNDAKVIGEAAE